MKELTVLPNCKILTPNLQNQLFNHIQHSDVTTTIKKHVYPLFAQNLGKADNIRQSKHVGGKNKLSICFSGVCRPNHSDNCTLWCICPPPYHLASCSDLDVLHHVWMGFLPTFLLGKSLLAVGILNTNTGGWKRH